MLDCVNVFEFLQEFGDHENVIKLLNVIKADNDKDIYLVFDYMGRFYASICSLLLGEVIKTSARVRLISGSTKTHISDN